VLGRLPIFAAVLAASAVTATAAAAAPAAPARSVTWATQANQVCTVWLAKAKKEFGSPVTTAQLYGFALKAKALESQELTVLQGIPGRNATASAALTAVKVDIAEIGSAITAWNKGNPAKFVTVLKAYLNDGRAKSAFAIAGATQCG
jgi:hypothetical protein